MEPITVGKRYQCELCGGHLLCTRAGDGPLECCGQLLKPTDTKKLPSAD
jgi:hypothetical protein